MYNKQILAVWGSPASGKTLTGVKLANMLSQKKRTSCFSFVIPLCR